MNKVFILLVFLTNIAFGQTRQHYNFCKMMQNDQSFLPDETKNEEENDKLYRKRAEAFKSNFELLMEISSKQGFPNSRTYNDSCIDNLTHVTFIHMAQTF